MVPEGIPSASQSVLFHSGGLDFGESVVFLSPIGVGEAFICKIALTVLGLAHSRDKACSATDIASFTQIIYPATGAIAISLSGEIKTRITKLVPYAPVLILRYSWAVRVLVPLDDFKSI